MALVLQVKDEANVSTYCIRDLCYVLPNPRAWYVRTCVGSDVFFCRMALARKILFVVAPLTLEDSPSRIAGEYVVVLKEGIEDEKCEL